MRLYIRKKRHSRHASQRVSSYTPLEEGLLGDELHVGFCLAHIGVKELALLHEVATHLLLGVVPRDAACNAKSEEIRSSECAIRVQVQSAVHEKHGAERVAGCTPGRTQ